VQRRAVELVNKVKSSCILLSVNTLYVECGLLGYKNRVRTSQETHYVSNTKPSQLMLCKVRFFHGGD
jgi:hypothetical protein